jgi:hypothetical protein
MMKNKGKECKNFKFHVNDRVGVNLSSGDVESGKIIKIVDGNKVIVLLDSKRKIKIRTKFIILEPDPEAFLNLETVDEDFEGAGFTQYDVKWDASNINFQLKNEIGHFFGWWRKIGDKAFAVDLMVEYEKLRYNCDTLCYVEDPREDIDSLNADICAAINKWYYFKCKGNFETINSLKLKAEKPTITVNKIQTIDKIITDLQNYRDSAIRSGGLYTFAFEGNNPNKEPSMRIVLDLCKQAKALGSSKVPSLYAGRALDVVSETDDEGIPVMQSSKRRAIEKGISTNSTSTLLEQLRVTKDKAQQRKLRAILRKLGHTGGIRNIKVGIK